MYKQEIMNSGVKNKISEQSVKIEKIEDYMEKLEKVLDNYVEKAIIDYKQENFNGNIEYRRKLQCLMKLSRKWKLIFQSELISIIKGKEKLKIE